MSSCKGFLCILLCALIFHVAHVDAVWQVNLISDIHYDPFYSRKGAFSHCTSSSKAQLGEPGCDSPKALMDSMVADLSLQNSNFTLYGGDFQRHKFNQTFPAYLIFNDTNKSLSSIKTGESPPSKSFVVVWGNNDVVPDYYFNTTRKEHTHLKERIQILNKSFFSPEESEKMIQCAFFARRSDKVTFVSLHSLIWSTTLKPPLADDVADPCGQFDFLEKELEFARKNQKKVIIIAHIPPILDVFIVIRNGKFTNASRDMLWKENYYTRYINLMSTYKDVVSLQLFAHLHLFYFLCFPGIGSPAFILPSISPIYGNVPSYLLSTFSDSWELTDLKQRSLLDKKWSSTVNVKDDLGLVDGFYNLNSMRERVKNLFTDNVAWLNYLKLHNGGKATNEVFYRKKTTSFARAVVVCSMLSGTYDTIKECVHDLQETSDQQESKHKTLIIIASIVGVLIGVCLIILVFFVVTKKRRRSFNEFNDPIATTNEHIIDVHTEPSSNDQKIHVNTH